MSAVLSFRQPDRAQMHARAAAMAERYGFCRLFALLLADEVLRRVDRREGFHAALRAVVRPRNARVFDSYNGPEDAA